MPWLPCAHTVRSGRSSPTAGGAETDLQQGLGRCVVSRNRRLPLERRWQRLLALCALVAAVMAGTVGVRSGQASGTTFNMKRSAAAENAGCIADAHATVQITSLGFAEKLRVSVSGLPAN